MRHAIVAVRYAEYVTAASALTYEAALAQILQAYLSHAVYDVPNVLAKHLGVPADAVRQAIDSLGERHPVAPRSPPETNGV